MVEDELGEEAEESDEEGYGGDSDGLDEGRVAYASHCDSGQDIQDSALL